MSEVKWIKITTDMFDNSKIKQLRRLPEGNNIVLIWVMLLTMAGKCNAGGMIILTENIPYTVEMLADELKFEISTVAMALESLQRFGMINTNENCFSITNWNEYQNVDGMEKIKEKNRLRVAKHRERKKLECNVTGNVTGNVTVTDSSYSISISNSYSKSIKEIIDYLNYKTNSHYTYKNQSNNKHIKARLDEGHTVDEFKLVIDTMSDKWGNDPKMVQYLRPETLFGNKFESYLNMKTVKKGDKSNNGTVELIGGYTVAELKEQGFTDAEIEAERRRLLMS